MVNDYSVLDNFRKYDDMVKDRVEHGIELYRKGWMELSVVDSEGKPVQGAKISVNQKDHAFKYGANLFMLDEMENAEKNQLYREQFRQCLNMATLPFYWCDLEPEKGKTRYHKDAPKIYRRPNIDLCIEYCKEHGIEPREHALAYEHFFPQWLIDADISTVKNHLEKRMKQVAELYAEDIPTIEITNEMCWPYSTTNYYMDRDYVKWCFETASKYFNNSTNKLSINEHPPVFADIRADNAYFYTIRDLIKSGVRVDQIGFQYHLWYSNNELRDYYCNPKHIYDVLDRYATFGLPLEITEITIPARSNSPEDEAFQAEVLERLYSVWFSHPNVEHIVYWNLVDGYAAFAQPGDMTCGENKYYGGLLRFDMTPKPAYDKIKELFQERWHTQTQVASREDGSAIFKGFYGTYDITVQLGDKVLAKELTLHKGSRNAYTVTL